MIKRIIVIVVLLLLVGAAVVKVVDLMTSDETKIWHVIDDVARAFGTRDRGDLVRHFAPSWRDETTGVERADLDRGLMWLFQDQSRVHEGLFTLRADPDANAYTVDVDGDRASARTEVAIEQRETGGWEEVWRIALELELERRDGRWMIASTRHETLSGARPF